MPTTLALLVVMLGCGSKSREPSTGSAGTPVPPSSSPAGNLVWLKLAASPYERGSPPPPPSTDGAEGDRLMMLDVATKTSKDIGKVVYPRLGAVTPRADAVYLFDKTSVFRVRKDGGGWKADAAVRMGATDETLDVVAPDGSSAVSFDIDGSICLATPGTTDCGTKIALPFEWDINSGAAYTSRNRLVVHVPTGRQDANAVAMGMKVQLAVVDLATKAVSRLHVPAIGYRATVSPDGRLAWIEHADGRLALSVASLDQLDAKQRFDLGPAEAQSDASCSFAGAERILCVVRTHLALVSLSTRDGSIVTLEPKNVMPDWLYTSSDGTWVAYARTSENLEEMYWLVTPIDHAAAQPLPLDADAKVLAWLR